MFSFEKSVQKEEVVQIEGFDTPLRGTRVLLVGSIDQAYKRFTMIESEALYRGKSILVLQEGSQASTVPLVVWRKKWDVVFRVKEPYDAQMLATYVANCQKPVRIFWIVDGRHGDIPRGLWSRWVKQDITLIGSCSADSTGGWIGGCEWETIFFPHQCPASTIERVLSSRGSGYSSLVQKCKEYLPEIASSGAAVVWTNIDEKEHRGSLYWYDPETKETEQSFTKQEVVQLLEGITKWFSEKS
jgi:hypothetical protein